jgi:hypothetical protein
VSVITDLIRERGEAEVVRSGVLAMLVPIGGCEVTRESGNRAEESALEVVRLMSYCETSGFGTE